MEYITHSPEETEAIGEKLAKKLTPGTVLAYRGDLGAGKTAFTRGLARGLGYTEPVTSPTYTIVNEYLGRRLPLSHFHMYRPAPDDDPWDTRRELGDTDRKISIEGGEGYEAVGL